MSEKKLDEAEGFSRRNLIEEDDVEGHSLNRDAEGAITRRDVDMGEGVSKRSFVGDEDDVEGHSMLRGGDDVMSRGDGISQRGADMGEGVSHKIGPGEGHTSRT